MLNLSLDKLFKVIILKGVYLSFSNINTTLKKNCCVMLSGTVLCHDGGMNVGSVCEGIWGRSMYCSSPHGGILILVVNGGVWNMSV